MTSCDPARPPHHPFGGRLLLAAAPAARGRDVALMQSLHNLLLQLLEPTPADLGPILVVDGVYGETTARAVRRLQLHFGLAGDGVVGEATYLLFGHAIVHPRPYGEPAFGSRPLAEGMSGGDVTVLQNRLNLFRYWSVIAHPASGRFDASTAKAVRQFKRDLSQSGRPGLADDGAVGASCLEELLLCTGAGGRTLREGHRGLDVAFMQTLLRRLGVYRDSVDGCFGPHTKDAVRRQQAVSGIAADGVCGPDTFFHVGANHNRAAPLQAHAQ